MTSLLEDAFAHHVWATIRLIDTCSELTAEQLDTAVPGTYGSILDTLRHTVAADAGYLSLLLGGGRRAEIEEDGMDLAALREAMLESGPAWSALLATELDPDAIVVRFRDDGSESHAPVGIRLAQAVHHCTDHRSQVCTALTALGMEPPEIDAWAFAASQGRLSQTDPTT